jgi:hypothetical protein
MPIACPDADAVTTPAVRRSRSCRRSECEESATTIFGQLFEPVSGTYTYVPGCEKSAQALLIDPVVNSIDRLPCVDVA